MATEVLLMADVEALGKEGDVVEVADGYARNYLFPKNLGAPVTDSTKRQLAKMQAEREVAREADLAAAREKAAGLENVSCTIPVKIGDGEKLYGSVTTTDIADALKGQGIELDRHMLVLEHPIKDLGVFNVPVNLHAEVQAAIKVWVVEE